MSGWMALAHLLQVGWNLVPGCLGFEDGSTVCQHLSVSVPW